MTKAHGIQMLPRALPAASEMALASPARCVPVTVRVEIALKE